METYDGIPGQLEYSASRLGQDVGSGARHVKSAASAEIKSLIADVEDLVARIADLKDDDVARVRDKVLRAVAGAKQSLMGSADSFRRQAQLAAATADDYVHDRPWQAVGVAALVGAAVGILAIRRS